MNTKYLLARAINAGVRSSEIRSSTGTAQADKCSSSQQRRLSSWPQQSSAEDAIPMAPGSATLRAIDDKCDLRTDEIACGTDG